MKSSALGSSALAAAAVVVFLHPWSLLAATPATSAPAAGEEKCDHAAATADSTAVRHVVPEDNSPALGPQTAPVTIVEFTDYACPYCKRADATVATLRQRYGKNLRWVVKQFPLPMHANAHQASLAALAAQEQDKFFEMHSALFAHSDALDRASLAQYAAAAGLDRKAFDAALSDPATEATLVRDQALAKKLGVQGVPYFVVNGVPVQGAQPIETFEGVIDSELARK